MVEKKVTTRIYRCEFCGKESTDMREIENCEIAHLSSEHNRKLYEIARKIDYFNKKYSSWSIKEELNPIYRELIDLIKDHQSEKETPKNLKISIEMSYEFKGSINIYATIEQCEGSNEHDKFIVYSSYGEKMTTEYGFHDVMNFFRDLEEGKYA